MLGTERSVTLLDVLVVAAESWKLLLIIPVLCGLIAFGLCKLQAQTYQSNAVLLMTETDVGFTIPRDLVLRALKTVPGAPNVDGIINGLTFGKPVHQTGSISMVPISLSTLDAKMSTLVLRAILTEYQAQFLETVRDQFKLAYQNELDALKREIQDRTKTIGTIRKMQEDHPASSSAATGSNMSSVAASLLSLTTGLEERQRKQAEMIRLLDSLPNHIVVKAPSSATLLYGTNTTIVVLFAMIGAEGLALVFAFLRDLTRRQANLPGGDEKIARIRRALGLRAIRLPHSADHR